jgi:hypothetical protein
VSAFDLTDLESVRAFLQYNADDVDQDPVIEGMITAASRSILEEFEREFAPATNAETRRFVFDLREPRLALSPYDLRAVTSVTLNANEAPGTPLTEWADYELAPYPAKHGVFTGIDFLTPIPLPVLTKRTTRCVVDVNGNWGFAEVPEDVKHWTNVTVAEWLRKDVAAFSNVFNLESGFLERPAALPAAAIAGLRHYRRIP